MKTRGCCPVCGHTDWRTLSRRGHDFEGEAVQFCLGCGGVFLSPHMDTAETAAYYRGEYSRRYRGAEQPDARALARRDAIAAERFTALAPRLQAGRRYLEIGCGAGNFLQRMAAGGFAAAGVEPSEGYAASGRERGLDIQTGTFPEVRGHHDQYDGIFFFHVLEHVPEPATFLAAVVAQLEPAHLQPGGFVAVEVPDVLAALDGKFRHWYFHRPHLIDFHRSCLTQLLARVGLEVESATYAAAPRPHHLLVVARPAAVTAVAPAPAEIAAWWRRLRRRLAYSRAIAPFSKLGFNQCRARIC